MNINFRYGYAVNDHRDYAPPQKVMAAATGGWVWPADLRASYEERLENERRASVEKSYLVPMQDVHIRQSLMTKNGNQILIRITLRDTSHSPGKAGGDQFHTTSTDRSGKLRMSLSVNAPRFVRQESDFSSLQEEYVYAGAFSVLATGDEGWARDLAKEIITDAMSAMMREVSFAAFDGAQPSQLSIFMQEALGRALDDTKTRVVDPSIISQQLVIKDSKPMKIEPQYLEGQGVW